MTKVIAVVFARDFSGDDLDDTFKSRLDKAAELFFKKTISEIIVTAFHTNSKGIHQFQLSTNYLVKKGIPKENIHSEKHAYGSWHEIRNIHYILEKLNPSKVILISSDFHLPRVENLFKSYYGSKYVFSSIACDLKGDKTSFEGEDSRLARDLIRIHGSEGISLLLCSPTDSTFVFDLFKDSGFTRFLDCKLKDFKKFDVWFQKKIEDPNYRLYLIKDKDRNVGMARMVFEKNVYTLRLFVASQFRNKSYDKTVLNLFSYEIPPKSKLVVEGTKESFKSLDVFTSLNFKQTHDSKDFIVFEKII